MEGRPSETVRDGAGEERGMATLINLPIVSTSERGDVVGRSLALPPPLSPRGTMREHGGLYENTPTAYMWLDLDGRVVRSNPSAQALLGHPSEGIVDRPFADLCPDIPEGARKARRLMAGLHNGQLVHDEDLVALKADGSPVWVSLTVYPILDGFGLLVGGRAMLLDVSQRKLVEACF